MPKMLGRYRREPVRDCRTMDHLCGRCSHGDETRWRKRAEKRQWRRLVASGRQDEAA